MRPSHLCHTAIVILLSLALGSKKSGAQQLKLGSNPTQIEKSAVLELESPNQGLLLTRVSDTSSVNGLVPPDGMIIYFQDADNPGLYIRKGGWWHQLVTKDGDGIVSINGDKTKNQTFTFSRDGGSPLGFLAPINGGQVLNIPDASAGTAGLITHEDQIIGGSKDFLKSPKIDDMTSGSVVFIGSGKLVSQDNGNLYWDATQHRLGINLGNGITPNNTLEINSGVNGNGGLRFTNLNAASTAVPNAGAIGVNADGDVVRIQNGIVSLNGLTEQSQTFTEGTSGDDFKISSVGATHTFNLPDASSTARGVINTGTQTIAGWKTFNESPSISSMSPGSLLFVGSSPGMKISESNANLYWDNTNKRLRIGPGSSGTPGNTLEINSGKIDSSGLKFTKLTSNSEADPNGSAVGVNEYGDVVKVLGIKKITATIDSTFKVPLISGLISTPLLEGSFTIHQPGVNEGANIIINPTAGIIKGMWIANSHVSSNDYISFDLYLNPGLLNLSNTTVNYHLILDIAIIQ